MNRPHRVDMVRVRAVRNRGAGRRGRDRGAQPARRRHRALYGQGQHQDRDQEAAEGVHLQKISIGRHGPRKSFRVMTFRR